ncbi:MAG: DUF1848 domain-containing protein [Ruminococcaceae bacterium]|nr:DUF1848 domain-containing protein [Oscillospiraceae bacterium]
MIISASRRTDIPAHYADWLFARLQAGFVTVANPYNPAQRRVVDLSPRAADGFVFWTKNPAPLLDRLGKLDAWPWYIHCTLTGAGPEVEPGLPDKDAVVLPAILRLAEKAGPRRVVWRYDPLVFGGHYTPAWHAERFAALANKLGGAVAGCVFSFYAPYKAADSRMKTLGLRPPTDNEKRHTAALLAAEAARCGLALASCAEALDLQQPGIAAARCVDAGRLSLIAGRVIAAGKDSGQRPGCGCARSVDIGAYGSCPAGCLYCYAVRGEAGVQRFMHSHNPLRDTGLGIR